MSHFYKKKIVPMNESPFLSLSLSPLSFLLIMLRSRSVKGHEADASNVSRRVGHSSNGFFSSSTRRSYLLGQRSARLATVIIQPLPLTAVHDDLFYRESRETPIAGADHFFFSRLNLHSIYLPRALSLQHARSRKTHFR